MRLAPLLILAALLVPTPARADTATCITAAEDGQRAQKAGRLVVANESFAECAAASCPASVRDDCSKWRAEVATHLSTFVVAAHAPDGTDAMDVTVRIDGVLASKQLDGRAIPTDPGRHRLSFERPGSPIVVQDVLLREGEQARLIDVAFVAESVDKSSRRHSPWPFVVGGIGIATLTTGLLIYLSAPSFPASCNADTRKCTPRGDEDITDINNQATKNNDVHAAGAITMVAGGAILAAGVVWYLLEPTRPKTTGAMPIIPWVAREGGGLFLSQSF